MRFAGAKRSGGDALKSSFRVAVQTIRDKGGGGGENINLERGFSLCNTDVLKRYSKSHWVL